MQSKDEVEIAIALAFYETYLALDYSFLNFFDEDEISEYKKKNKAKISRNNHKIYAAKSDMMNKFTEPLESLDKRTINWKGN